MRIAKSVRWIMTAMLVTVPALALDAHAAAASEDGYYTPSECLDGDGGPHDLVQTWILSSSNPDQSIQLRCGDPTKGVLHIDHDHPITSDAKFLTCLDKVFFRGHAAGAGTSAGTTQWKYSFTGGTATAVYINSTGDILTAYASGNTKSNNWTACAR